MRYFLLKICKNRSALPAAGCFAPRFPASGRLGTPLLDPCQLPLPPIENSWLRHCLALSFEDF